MPKLKELVKVQFPSAKETYYFTAAELLNFFNRDEEAKKIWEIAMKRGDYVAKNIHKIRRGGLVK